jgi:adenylyl-sulfate kinase
VNAGQIGLGVVYKNFAREPIEVLPVPTRIFGIGMHKTATTSLDKALTILGYKSGHWRSAHWAKAIWEEMLESGRSRTLERDYALCDLPISMLFRELDKAYPGSKFILTLRNENEWIESIRTHFSEKNQFYAQWNTDPFTHRIHNELYGRKKFDEGVMRARFRRHNAEVLEHFKDRPRDLLVMDMSKGAGWYELCGFLRKPVPEVPYPNENKLASLAKTTVSTTTPGPAKVIWLTGLSGSGKTTIATAIAKELSTRAIPVEVLDGDALRNFMPTGFSREEREAHAKRVAFMANRLAQHGVTAIVALISPYRSSRAYARDLCGESFVEVHVSTSLEVCEGRDVKGLYKKARAGLIHEFTGIDDPYEAPESPELKIDSSTESVDTLTNAVIKVALGLDQAVTQ